MDSVPPRPKASTGGIESDLWLLIEAGRSERNYWRDLWRYRELLAFLVWRDLLVRYKQTVIGVAWALIRPFLTMVIFTVVFHKLAGLKSETVPYPVLVFVALLPWQFVSTAVSEASNSLIGNANLISKIYFPRLIVPAGSVLTSLADFLISAVFLGVLMAWYGCRPGVTVLLLPFLLLLAFAATLGPALWLCALNVKYRDFRYVVPFLVQFGLYISPVGFASDIVPGHWRLLYSLNPMVGIIDGFRWALLPGSGALYWPGLAFSGATTLFLLWTGIRYFRQTEKTFADVI